MIIKDAKGQQYRLTKAYLDEYPLCYDHSRRVILTELPKYLRRKVVPIPYRDSEGKLCKSSSPNTFPNCGPFHLGCREFSPTTFAKILKAAGVKKARKKKAGK